MKSYEYVNNLGMPAKVTKTGDGEYKVESGGKAIKIITDEGLIYNFIWWQEHGELIQDALPYLTADQREFLMTADIFDDVFNSEEGK